MSKWALKLTELVIALVLTFIGSSFFMQLYNKPEVSYEIKEYVLPETYSQGLSSIGLLPIPALSIIEIKNIGRSTSKDISLHFQTNNNVSITKGMVVQQEGASAPIESEQLKNGAALLKIESKTLRPTEKIIAKVFTTVPANFFPVLTLMDSGKILSVDQLRKSQETWKLVFSIVTISIAAILGAFVSYKAFKIGYRQGQQTQTSSRPN